jgi:hypothetical protein
VIVQRLDVDDSQRPGLDLRDVLAVLRMEMRRWMVRAVHPETQSRFSNRSPTGLAARDLSAAG